VKTFAEEAKELKKIHGVISVAFLRRKFRLDERTATILFEMVEKSNKKEKNESSSES
jgi:hypothetical protein